MDSSANSGDSDAQRVRCPICLDVYTAPKNLPCLHTYCQHCLNKYIVKNVRMRENGATFSCPECRKETFPPLPDIPVDKWAEHYPYNTVLLSVLPPEKRKVEKSCDSCLYEGTSVRATSYCTVCKEALCLTCDSVHRKTKATRDHTVVNIQDIITDLELAVSLSVSVTCSEHVGKELEFYCKSHSIMCCSECFYKKHRGCIGFLQLKDHFEGLLKEKESNRVVERLKQLRSHLDKFKNENEASFRRIEAEVKNIPDEIELIRKKLNTLLDSVKSKITMEKNALLKEESMVRHEENQQCDSICSAITGSLHLLETVLAHGNALHVLTTLHKTEEQLVHYESAVKEKYHEVRQVDAKLCLDDHLLSLVKSSDVTMAKIDIVEKKHSLVPSCLPLTIVKTVNTTADARNASEAKKKSVEGLDSPRKYLNSKPLKDCKPEIIKQFNADYPDGKKSWYTGIICLHDDKIMLVDHLNCTCRLYDSAYKHLADYKLTSGPYGVCVVEGSQVAVTLPYEKIIQLLTVDRSIQPGRKINTSQSFFGITSLSIDQMIVSGLRDGFLYWCIVSMDGSEKSFVKVCPSSRISHVALNNRRTGIYVSCYTNTAGVYAYSVKGILMFKYEHKLLNGAYGLAVDREDNLYIVGQQSRNIHQVSSSGDPLQVFSKEITNSPSAICFSSSGDEFQLIDINGVQKFKLK